MKNNYGRMLFILLVGVWLIGIALPGQCAALKAGSFTGEATANSVWNFSAVWTDDKGIWPDLDPHGYSEGSPSMDYGYLLGPNAGWLDHTIGTVRLTIPQNPADADITQWWPFVPAPDGFIGFTPQAGATSNETYQEPGYATLQPDPVAIESEIGGDPLFDHGVDFVADELDLTPAVADAADIGVYNPGDNLPGIQIIQRGELGKLEPSIPDATTHLIPQKYVPYKEDTTTDPATVTPAWMAVSRVPLALVGVWSDAMHTQPLKAKLVPVNSINKTWKQTYNVIQFLEPDKLAGVRRVYVSYYTPGTNYVIVQRSQMPMPYRVYQVNLKDANSDHVEFNDAITLLDPNRQGDPANEATPANQCGILGIYVTPKLDGPEADDPTNYWDPAAFAPGAKRYQKVANMGQAFFSTKPGDAYLAAGTPYYVKVASNAVDSVTRYDDPTDTTNYYPDMSGVAGGYCAKAGIIKLGVPLPNVPLASAGTDGAGNPRETSYAGIPVSVKYRYLSNNLFTLGQNDRVSVVNRIDNLRPPLPEGVTYDYKSTQGQANGNGKYEIKDPPYLPDGTYAASLGYSCTWAQPVVWLTFHDGGRSIPMQWDGKGSLRTGVTFRVSVSAGLNMSNLKQQPTGNPALDAPDVNNKLIYDNYGWPMFYAPALRAADDGTPKARLLDFTCGYADEKGNAQIAEDKDKSVTVHDSRPPMGEMINHAGIGHVMDWLTCYPDSWGASWPYGYDVMPLTSEPEEQANPADPDAGAGSTQFVFRVRYHNWDALQPKPWLHSYDDNWNAWSGYRESASGVVLYLDASGTGDYQPHFMRREFPEQASNIGGTGGDVYIYRVMPHHTIGQSGSNKFWPINQGALWNDRTRTVTYDTQLYESLAVGQYHYFFGCSDDSLTFDNGSFPFENQTGTVLPSGLTGRQEWGEDLGGNWSSHSSTGLDPSWPRTVDGYEEVNRTAQRRFSADDKIAYDWTLYVDREVRAPGRFEDYLQNSIGFTYPYPCTEHPEVTCELLIPEYDDLGNHYDHPVLYGAGRFHGTIYPFRSAVNPAHPGVRGTGDPAALAETSGSWSSDTNVFRILYRGMTADNKPPISVKLYINNASEKSPDDTAHAYSAYTMLPKPDQVKPLDYRRGVWYEYKMQSGTQELPYGPHTYYFEADDGVHIARYPVRPDLYTYDGNIFTDWWVPTRNAASERRNPDYKDNNYIPGPYVNHAPVLSNPSVNPGTGKEGTAFQFRVKYSDADGQRVGSAYIWIKTADGLAPRQFKMIPDPALYKNLDPTADNSQLYKDGMWFVLDTGSEGVALQKGVRAYRFEFTDDWGHQDNQKDTRPGETTYLPVGDWISGPVISGNVAPTLTKGSVTAQDSTANSATMWTYKVTYRDANNDPPKLIKLYIGRLQGADRTDPNPQSKVKTIVWDDGHTMSPSDPSDSVYSDGADYYYQTRLGGPDVNSTEVQYYYAFEAFDGIDYATYKSSSIDEERSDAAGCFILQDVDPTDSTGSSAQNFALRAKTARMVSVTAGAASFDPDPQKVGDIVRIWGVYTNESLTGTNYYAGRAGTDYAGGVITLDSAFPASSAWLLVEAQSPIVGPLPMQQQSAPAGVIPDVEVYQDYANNGAPLLLTDQKNGFISQDGSDKAVVLMNGVAVYEGYPSGTYVAPELPSTIASVEGVYWLNDNDSTRKYTNYFDPTLLDTPVVRQATVSNTKKLISFADPEQIYRVLGVYAASDLTGTNYYLGAGYPTTPGAADGYLWQPAIRVSGNIIWPTRPNDIASIKGVYQSMSVNDSNGSYLASDASPYVLTARVSSDGSTIDIAPRDAVAIKAILQINEKSDLSGVVYYQAADPVNGAPYTGLPITPIPGSNPASDSDVYVSFIPNKNFGPYNEYVATKTSVPASASTVYIAYYAPGTLDTNNQLTLTSDFPSSPGPAYVKIWAKAFNPGDKYVRLTKPLPDLSTTATWINSGAVAPAATDIGSVTGVWMGGQEYYLGTKNPFKPGDTQIRLARSIASATGPITVTYMPTQRPVTIKYSDIRYTHLLSGVAEQVNSAGPVMAQGTTHYTPDGANVDLGGGIYNVHITGNKDADLTGGIVGIWLNPQMSGINYFDPRRTTRFADNPLHVRLSTEVPTGTAMLYARYYQKGQYYVDRWNRTLRFEEPVDSLTRIQASYFFGTKMAKTIGRNTLPELSGGNVVEITGSRNTQYVYSVKYKDIDGRNGQVPSFVRVYIDGKPYDMAPPSGGTPAYNLGAVFTYTPSGSLQGGSHTYHFEASDGAGVAWFDRSGGHQSEQGLNPQQIVELQGPWVNDPPELSKGSYLSTQNPNGIGPKDSVDYLVTLKDVDNDPPFFFDPEGHHDTLGADVSGAPRVWIDSSSTEDSTTPVTGVITAIEPDPSEVSMKRVMVVNTYDANGNLVEPNWSSDQFAGKLMQITNGNLWNDVSPSPYLRVYLIQSNSAHKLVIATDDLSRDNLVVPNDPTTGTPRLIGFRINGLLMSKVDATQENYTQGIDYKITVPRLNVGNHKFHFVARTRETKPDWLSAMPSYSKKQPYSDPAARFPQTGDLSGPNVISSIPPDNVPPTMDYTPLSSKSTLFRGPQAQYATVMSPNEVKPSKYNPLLSILGVYRNANFDEHLDQALRVNYFDSTTKNPPATNDPALLTPNLPVAKDTDELVMLGRAASSFSVTPDVASAIGTVTGVYLASDTRLLTNYPVASPTLVSGNVTLTGALPAGTSNVYIKYKPSTATIPSSGNGTATLPLGSPDSIAYVVGVYTEADTGMTNNLVDPSTFTPGDATIQALAPVPAATSLIVKYVPWPPAYIKYFAVDPGTAGTNHGVYFAGEPLTFMVKYKDENNHPPTYHDGVQGYVKVVFDDSGRTANLVPMGTVTSYKDGAVYGVTLTDVPEGIHAYHFEASDGYVVTKFPDTVTSHEKLQINYKPVLKSGGVDHTSGATTFLFNCTYQDKDNVAPTTGFVRLVLTDHNDPTWTKSVTMTQADLAPNWGVGVRYTASIDASKKQDGSTDYPAGTYDTTFFANDGNQDADPLTGPQITVRALNRAPVIVNYEVKKLLANDTLGNGAGKTTDTFVYRGWYRDDDGDFPIAVFNGVRQTALTLIVDKGTSTEQTMPMTLVPIPQPAPPAPPVLPDYTAVAGVEFQARMSGKKLGAGNHTYTVIASDGTDNAVFAPGVPDIKNGPILMIPFFSLQAVGKDGELITDHSIVGQEVLIQGKMFFPYTTSDQQPGNISNITIQVTKPDTTAITLNATLDNIVQSSPTNPQNWQGDITVKYSGYVDPALITGQSLTLTASGNWAISATWPGDASYDGAQTDSNMDGHNDQVRINVSGPSRTVAVSDPLKPDTSTPVPDMITPPMIIGSTSPGGIFGYDRALAMQIVRWSPSSKSYFWYDTGGIFPPMQPGDAVWIKPKSGTTGVPGSGYPAAEALGTTGLRTAAPSSPTVVPIAWPASHINGVYTNANRTGGNYYDHSHALTPFSSGDDQVVLTSALPGVTQVWVDYVAPQTGVDEGWIALDNPAVEKALVGHDPRYMHSKYKLVKVLAQAYPLLTGASGAPVLDTQTKLPLLKPCTISLTAGWNQIGNIFYNWRKAAQTGTVLRNGDGSVDLGKVVPTNISLIGKVLGVYLTAECTGTNYYQPGLSTEPFRRGDPADPNHPPIVLTQNLPAGTTTVYVKHELYPREDVGIPVSEVTVNYLGQQKSLADAKVAGWVTDYLWRYDAVLRNYVRVQDKAGFERVLKSWSGYWIRAYVDCQLQVNPNTSFNGVLNSAATAATVAGESDGDQLEMPPPAPK